MEIPITSSTWQSTGSSISLRVAESQFHDYFSIQYLNLKLVLIFILSLRIWKYFCEDHTQSQLVSQRTPAHRSLRSCWAQRWKGWWGILLGEDRSGCTLLAGWWRSQNGLLRNCVGKNLSSDALAFCQSTTKWHRFRMVTWGGHRGSTALTFLCVRHGK